MIIMKPLHIVLVAAMAFQTMLFVSTFIEARPLLTPGNKYCSSCWWMGTHSGSWRRASPPPPPSHSGGPTPMQQCGVNVTKPPHRRPPPPAPSHGPIPASSYNINNLRGTTPSQYPKAASM